MGELLEAAKALSAPTMKLMDMVGSAIGTAYAPVHKRKMADATVYEINAIGEAMRKAADLPIVYNQDGVAINSEDFNRLMQRAGTRLALQETIKQHNIERVVDNAYEILENEETCSEDPVEQGWINRFFDSVADVSDEDLQKLWGKVLAGEIKQPKSYSLRTLETLKNLSKHEAELFQKVSSIVACLDNNFFVTANTDILKKYDIAYGEILLLDECGLINSDGMVSLYPKVSGDQDKAIYNKNYILLLKKPLQEQIISFSVFCLTRAGIQLHSILMPEANKEYMYDLAKEIVSDNKTTITGHKVNYIDAGIINYDKTVLFEFPEK